MEFITMKAILSATALAALLLVSVYAEDKAPAAAADASAPAADASKEDAAKADEAKKKEEEDKKKAH